jgi:hypothetical protein
MLSVSTIVNSLGHSIGFTTEYPRHLYVEKIVVFGFQVNGNLDITEMGKLTVYMRDGTNYSFDCWADTVYCGQFGINISDDGTRIYVNSPEKGLWCYSYNGEIIWKTRYTSVGDVIVNPNGTITCIASTKIVLLNENGKVINSRKILPYHASKASENIIYIAISNSKVALLDCETLDIIWETSLNEMDLDSSRAAIIYRDMLIISGCRRSRMLYIPVDLPATVVKNCHYDESLFQKQGYSAFIKKLEHN